MTFLTTPDEVRLRYTDRGVENGGTFVLLHGWKQSHRLWDPVMYRLAQRHRVVAFDSRGMGQSDKPNSRYDFIELATDLEFVIRSLGLERVALVGWSMGCSVALQYMENDAAEVSALVLLNGPVRLVGTDDFSYGLSPEKLDGYLQDMRDRWPGSEWDFLRDSLLHPRPELVDLLVRESLQTPLEIALRLVEQQASLDHRSVVADLDIPVLAVYSRFDPYYPADLAAWIAETAQHGEAAYLSDSAHCAPLEEPERLCEILESFATRVWNS